MKYLTMLGLILVLIFSTIVISCSDDSSNNAPTASFNSITNQFFVTGAKISSLNGLYVDSGLRFNNRGVFTNYVSSGIRQINYGTNSLGYGAENAWNMYEYLTGLSYSNSSSSFNVPENGWGAAYTNDLPAPTIRYVHGITGFNVTNDALTVSYTFNDPDNDSEGNTVIQWLRSSTVSGQGTIIPNANSSSYTLTASDLHQYISVVVVPVDSKQKVGTSITSVAFGPITNR